jgi:hypothetical protein
MVKRTLVVLGVMCLVLASIGTASAQFGRFAGCMPPAVFLPVPCPPGFTTETVVQKWSAKIEGPCPPPGMPACGVGRRIRRAGVLGPIFRGLANPFDVIFGGGGGVYGCRRNRDNPCGPLFGPVAQAFVAIPTAVAAPGVGMFGWLW